MNQLTSGNTDKTLSFAPAGFNTFQTTINVTGGNGYTLALGSIDQGFGGPLSFNAVSANLSIGAIGSSSAVSSLAVGGEANTTITGAIATNGNVTKTGGGTLALGGTSGYTTVTIFEGGTVNAATFADYGSNSSLGSRSAADDAGGNVGLLFRGGTLQYTGSTAQSTDRSIRLSTTGGGGTIDASGSDPSATLSFTAAASTNFFENPGSRTLTLTGSNTGTNTFAMAIAEAGGTTSLVKSGAGRWVLSGTSTYTGATSIAAGTLLVTGSVDATAVSVASGGTLGGSGTIGGPVSISAGGILAPGTSPGTLTINNTLALDAASILNFEIDAIDPSSSVLNDLIAGVTDLTLGGTLNLSGTGDFSTVTQGTTWRLFDYSGTLTDNTLSLGTAPTLASGLSFVVDTSTANQVNLSIVPEPGSLALAALGLATAGWVAAHRRR